MDLHYIFSATYFEDILITLKFFRIKFESRKKTLRMYKYNILTLYELQIKLNLNPHNYNVSCIMIHQI